MGLSWLPPPPNKTLSYTPVTCHALPRRTLRHRLFAIVDAPDTNDGHPNSGLRNARLALRTPNHSR